LGDGLTITKINKSNGLIGGKTDDTGNLYHRMVSNALRREIIEERIEANIEPLSEADMTVEIQSRFRRGSAWFRPILDAEGHPTALVVHKDSEDDGEAYLRFIFKAKGQAEYLSLQDGTKVSDEAVEPFLAARSKPTNQGLSDGNEIMFVVYKLSSIIEIALTANAIASAIRSTPCRASVAPTC
jgi:hypothetical protein